MNSEPMDRRVIPAPVVSFSAVWERAVIKELAAITYELSSGVFKDSGELRGRLQSVIEYLESEFETHGAQDEANLLFKDIMEGLTGWKYE